MLFFFFWSFLAANESIMAVNWNVFSLWICDKYPLTGLRGCPIRNKQKCFWLPCLLSPGVFLSAAVLFLHCHVSRLRRIGPVWLAVRRRRGRSHSDLSQRLLGKWVWRSKCLWGVCTFPCLICMCSHSGFLHVPLHEQFLVCTWA